MTDSNDETSQVLALREQGMGVNRIAAMLGIGSGRVARIIESHGLRKEKREPDQALRDRIIELRKANVPAREIANSVGWSEAFVQRVLRDAGISGWEANRLIRAEARKTEHAKIAAAYAAGESASSISKRLGVRKSVVTDIAKAAGLYREQDQMSNEQRQQAIILRERGMTIPAIAKTIGRSPAAVREWLVKHNLNERIVRPIRIEGDIAYVPLTQSKEAIIDAADAERVGRFNWSVIKANAHNHYATGTVDGKSVVLHRFIIDPDPDLFVDHINHNGLDCRRANLRQVNASLNAFNARRYRDTGLPKGIYRCKGGYFAMLRSVVCKTVEDAVAVRRAHYEAQHGAEFIETDKFTPDMIDPDTGEILDA